MTSQAAGLLLKRALRQFSPEIFLHPVWVRFAYLLNDPAAVHIQPLMDAAKLMRADGDHQGACAVLFLAAALQTHLRDDAGALATLEQALKQAKRHQLRQCLIWADWGAAAVCLRQGAFLRCAGYLRNLREIILDDGDWVLADLVEMIHLWLERLDGPVSGAGALLEQASDPLLQEVLAALLAWGEVPPGASPEYPAAQAYPRGEPARGWRSLVHRALAWMGREPAPAAPPAAEPAELPLKTTPLVAEPQVPPPEPEPPPRFDAEPPPQPEPEPPLPPPPPPVETRVEPPRPKKGGPEIEMYFLGAFRVSAGEQPLTDWPSQKSLSILKYLAANPDKPIPKDILMDQFWAETDPEVARRNLHQAIYALRQALKRSQADFAYILFQNDCYRLNPELEVWLDFAEFEKHVRAARQLEENGSQPQAIAEYAIAETLYQGDFLEEDPYEEWPNPLRTYYRGLYLEVLEQLSRYHFEQKQYYAAIILCQKTLAKDNCAEQAYRCLIRCYLAEGQRQQAARIYQACLQTLKQELNLTPSEETRALYPLIFTSKG